MHDAGRRRVSQGRGKLQRVVDRFARVEGTLVANDVADRASGDELVRDEVQSAVFADVKNAGDVVVIEPRRRPRFVEKPLDRAGVAAERGRQNFQRHDAIEALVDGPKHCTHSARSDRRFDAKMTEAASDGGGHGFGHGRRIAREEARPQRGILGASRRLRIPRSTTPFRIHDGLRTIEFNRGLDEGRLRTRLVRFAGGVRDMRFVR